MTGRIFAELILSVGFIITNIIFCFLFLIFAVLHHQRLYVSILIDWAPEMDDDLQQRYYVE